MEKKFSWQLIYIFVSEEVNDTFPPTFPFFLEC